MTDAQFTNGGTAPTLETRCPHCGTTCTPVNGLAVCQCPSCKTEFRISNTQFQRG